MLLKLRTTVWCERILPGLYILGPPPGALCHRVASWLRRKCLGRATPDNIEGSFQLSVQFLRQCVLPATRGSKRHTASILGKGWLSLTCKDAGERPTSASQQSRQACGRACCSRYSVLLLFLVCSVFTDFHKVIRLALWDGSVLPGSAFWVQGSPPPKYIWHGRWW